MTSKVDGGEQNDKEKRQPQDVTNIQFRLGQVLQKIIVICGPVKCMKIID